MRVDLIFETDRFNLSDEKDYFINPCCFGDDFGRWLKVELANLGIHAHEPDQEDWGWYIDATHEDARYFIGITGIPGEDDLTTNHGEWRLMVERKRPLWHLITGKNKITPDDPIITTLTNLLKEKLGVAEVQADEQS